LETKNIDKYWNARMVEVKQYYLKLEDMPSSERIIFKLICSVSARTKGRSKHYSLVNDDADIVPGLIRVRPSGVTGEDKNKQAYVIEFGSEDIHAKDIVAGTISRPLIATRVLTSLDEFIDEANEQEEQSQATTLQDSYPNIEYAENDSIEESITESLELSEEEACELAIVHDESLSNPANKDNEYLSEIQAPKVPPISLVHDEYAFLDKDNRDGEAALEASKSGEQKKDKPRALVVDDSPSVRKQLEIELELFNVNVDYAATAKEAMDLLDSDVYDVAFLDVVLPDNDGFSICRHIKEKISETSVIMLTGKAKQADKVKGALAGCDAYLVKPVGRMTFQTTVRDYLSLVESISAVEA
jgi:CheY-like chemotaxis protein